MKTLLPIDIVFSNSKRNTFQWKQQIETVVGKQTVNHVGSVPSSLESSLIELIKLAKQQEQELIGLRRQVEQLEGRVTELSKNQIQEPKVVHITPSISTKKNK